jgi:hypothetical protein
MKKLYQKTIQPLETPNDDDDDDNDDDDDSDDGAEDLFCAQ